MHIARYPKVFVGVSFATLLLGLLCWALTRGEVAHAQSATTKSAPATVTTTVTAEPMGRLFFTNSTALRAGAFLFQLKGLPPPPDNSHYELWLHSAETPTLRLGRLRVTNGMATLQGKIGYSPLATYDHALISLETDDNDKIATVLLTATLPASLGELLTKLLVETASPLAETEVISGIMTGAKTQGLLAVKHTGFLREQLSQDNLPEARRHTEHIINIFDGEDGVMFSDLDRNGQIQNPGDGVGIRVYLDEAQASTRKLLDLIHEFPEPSGGQDNVPQIMAALEAGQAGVPTVFEKAPKIFASDTVTEANVHAHDLTVIVDEVAQHVTEAYTRTLNLAAYTFYPPAKPLAVPTTVARRTPPTRTPTPTATPQPIAAVAVAMTTAVAAQPVAAGAEDHQHSTQPVQPRIEISVPVAQGWRNPADGSLYLPVPAGDYILGSTDETSASPLEKPQHTVAVAEFWLQQSETTNAQYARCVTAGVCTPPENEQWNDPAYANHPVSQISWQQARVYAEWVGGRLPTEAEWEAACRGPDAHAFPWGDEPPNERRANYNSDVGDTTPVGNYSAGASPLGLVDLSGNVWEWVSTLDRSYPYTNTDGREATDAAGKRIARGGSFYYTQYQIRCAARTGFAPNSNSQPIGVRVALDKPINRWRHAVDKAFYRYIPGGEFAMGSTATSAVSPREEPRHPVTVRDFWLQETETTNTQYARCVTAGVCTAPANTRWSDPAFADHPVMNITWQQANSYAAWVGGRLPTEAEWERACRGPEGRTYAWGEEPPSDALSNYNNAVGDTTPVGSYPTGASAEGVQDLSGNVWEWVSSLEADYPYDAADGREAADATGKRSVRGGSFYYTQYQIRCAARTGFAPETDSQPIGVRVVLDNPQ